jgi:low temperature requirement protein LtrA
LAIAAGGDRDLRRVLMRIAPSAALAPLTILAAGVVGGHWQVALWCVALVILYSEPLIGLGRGWRVLPTHFAERYGLIVIIALGETIIAIGVGAPDVPLTLGPVSAAILGIVVIAALWWAYFDVVAVRTQAELSRTSDEARLWLARDLYSYLHLPMIAGIVMFALGAQETIAHVREPLAVVPAVALCGGLSLYFFAHVILRVRLVFSLRRATSERPAYVGPGRLASAIAMLVLIPAALTLPALASLALAAAVCWALIAWDVIHYHEDRIEVRRTRP